MRNYTTAGEMLQEESYAAPGRIESGEERISSVWREQEDFLEEVTSMRKALHRLRCRTGPQSF